VIHPKALGINSANRASGLDDVGVDVIDAQIAKDHVAFRVANIKG
jgi:hypothetical protein